MRIKNLMKTGVINLLFQILFLLAFYIWGSESQVNLSGIFKIVFYILIVFVPCLVWATFFYLQDRIEPEPTHYVAFAFITGMMIASLFQIPLENYIFGLDSWILSSQTSLILGSIFVLGISTSFLFYLSIRYGFYLSKEFDEPVDGMVYGAFIGSGFAAVKTLNYLFNYDNLTLFATGYITSMNILVYASIASLVGFYIGKSKFIKTKKTFNLIMSVIIGTILIAIFNIISNLFYLQGEKSGFLYTLLLTLLLSIIMLVIVFIEMRKLTKKDMHEDVKVSSKLDIPVFIVMLLFIIPGIISQYYYTKNDVMYDSKSGIEFNYSKKLVPTSGRIKIGLFDQILFRRENSASKNNIRSTYTVILKNSIFDSDKLAIEDFISIENIQYPVNREFIDIDGLKSMRLKYCNLNQNESHSWYPEMMLNVMTILPYKNQSLIFLFSASIKNYDQDYLYYEAIINSLNLSK